MINLEVFNAKKPIISMLHLKPLQGQPGYKGLEVVKTSAQTDLDRLVRAGVNGILIENWAEDSNSPFTSKQTADSMLKVTTQITNRLAIPFGINVLNNDYRAAFKIAAETGASFVQMDVLVDRVISDFSYSQFAKENPFEIAVDIRAVQKLRTMYNLNAVPLLIFIQPKHYRMLDPKKSIEASAKEAIEAGADGIIITKSTGVAPSVDLIRRVRTTVGRFAKVGIGSGFSRENARNFLPDVDFAIVGTDLKISGITDNPVSEVAARQLIQIAATFQNDRG